MHVSLTHTCVPFPFPILCTLATVYVAQCNLWLVDVNHES